MTLENGPRRAIGADDFKIDCRSPKPPPCQFSVRHVQHPVGFEPFGDVVVTADRDESPRNFPRPNRHRYRGRADAGDGAIDDRSEFIKCNQRLLSEQVPAPDRT